MNNLSTTQPRSFIEAALVLLLLLLLLFLLHSVISPFLGVFTYAIILAVSLHKPFEWLVSRLRNKRKLASLIYALLLIVILALPFIYIIISLTHSITQAQIWIANAKTNGVPPLPEWVKPLPFAGEKISTFWDTLQKDPSGTIDLYEDQIKLILKNMLAGGAGIALSSLELILGIIVSALLLGRGEKSLQPIYFFLKKIVGDPLGPSLVNTSGRAIKGVAVGVMGTGLIAGALAWIGFAIAGISFAGLLAAITFFMVVVQIGPLLVWLPVAIWLGSQGQTGAAIFLSIYGMIVLMGVDNVLKPFLIARSGKLPVWVLFIGVIGGMAAWGFTGMFKGAIILAVFYSIFSTWYSNSNNVPSQQPQKI